MLIHKQIREELTALLKENIKIEGSFYAGRPAFIDLESEPTAIAVFLDEAVRQESTMCDNEWSATLNVVIYHKSFEGEGELDNIAEQIANLFENTVFDTLDSHELVQYGYEQDTQQRTWYIANLQYAISYQRQEENE